MKKYIVLLCLLPVIAAGQNISIGKKQVNFAPGFPQVFKGGVEYGQSNQIPTYTLGNIDNYYANHAETPIYFPTPVANDSSAIHPSVLDMYNETGRTTWNGYRYWMAYTPLPAINPDPNENPSLVASNDGIKFVEPEGIQNPIKKRPPVSYNSDPFLYFEKDSLWLCYRTWHGVGQACIECKKSKDGIHWNDSITLIQLSTAATLNTVTSPSLIKDDNYYYIYALNRTAANVYPVSGETVPYIHRFRSTSLHSGNFILYDTVSILTTNTKLGDIGTNSPSGVYTSGVLWYPWHFEIKKIGLDFLMSLYVRSNSESYQRMYLASSTNAKSFTLAKYSFMSQYMSESSGKWDEGYYKFSIIPYKDYNDSTALKLYYSGFAGFGDGYPVYIGKSDLRKANTVVSIVKGGNTIDSATFNTVMDSAIALQGDYVLGDKFNRTITNGFGTSNSGYIYTYGLYNYFQVSPNYGYSQYSNPRPEIILPAHKDYELRFVADQIASDWVFYKLKQVDANNYIAYSPYNGVLYLYAGGSRKIRMNPFEIMTEKNDYRITVINNTVSVYINGAKSFDYTFTVSDFADQAAMDAMMNSTYVGIWINNTNWKIHALTMKSFD